MGPEELKLANGEPIEVGGVYLAEDGGKWRVLATDCLSPLGPVVMMSLDGRGMAAFGDVVLADKAGVSRFGSCRLARRYREPREFFLAPSTARGWCVLTEIEARHLADDARVDIIRVREVPDADS